MLVFNEFSLQTKLFYSVITQAQGKNHGQKGWIYVRTKRLSHNGSGRAGRRMSLKEMRKKRRGRRIETIVQSYLNNKDHPTVLF